MDDRKYEQNGESEVIVEYVPQNRGRRFHHFGGRTRPVSPLGFAVLAAAGAAALCLTLAIGFIMLFFALGAGLLLLLRRRLAGR